MINKYKRKASSRWSQLVYFLAFTFLLNWIGSISQAFAGSGSLPRFGPTVGIGVPHPLFGDLNFFITRHLSIAVGAGGLAVPYKTGGSEVHAGIMGYDGRVRWHPWGGSFFMGTAIGLQRLYGTTSESITVLDTSIDTSIKMSVVSPYITPHMGWLWVFQSGFVLGLDFGWQFPLSSKTELEASATTSNALANNAIELVQQTQQYQALENDVKDIGNKIGKISLPYFTVLRIGWFF
jgi:hypothetical protein